MGLVVSLQWGPLVDVPANPIIGSHYTHRQPGFEGIWEYIGPTMTSDVGQFRYFGGPKPKAVMARNAQFVTLGWCNLTPVDAPAHQVAERATIPDTSSVPQWRLMVHSVPGECPCGINRKDCGYHS